MMTGSVLSYVPKIMVNRLAASATFWFLLIWIFILQISGSDPEWDDTFNHHFYQLVNYDNELLAMFDELDELQEEIERS